MSENAIAKEIVDTGFHIHTALGPGLLESVYEAVLAYGFRADLIVEDKVIVEVKPSEILARFTKSSF